MSTRGCSIRRTLVFFLPLYTVSLGADSSQALPKVSTFAPSRDLVSQLQSYVARLERAVENEAIYIDLSPEIAGQANALIFIAVSLGLHDEDTKYRTSSTAIAQAAKEVALTNDFITAKAAVAKLRAGVDGETKDRQAALRDVNAVSLRELMKEVMRITVRIDFQTRRLGKNTEDLPSRAAVLAVTGQGLINDPQRARMGMVPARLMGLSMKHQWEHLCKQMRDSAGDLNRAARRQDEAGIREAHCRLRESCDTCHMIFK